MLDGLLGKEFKRDLNIVRIFTAPYDQTLNSDIATLPGLLP